LLGKQEAKLVIVSQGIKSKNIDRFTALSFQSKDGIKKINNRQISKIKYYTQIA